jgi:alpha-L-rhamnosidase
MLSPVRVTRPRFETLTDETFVGVDKPRLSWKTQTELQGWKQRSAEIEVTRAGSSQTSVIDGRDSVLVEWPFAPLSPRESVSIRVRVRGRDGSESEWSLPASITAGFLGGDEWQAQFVGSGSETPALLRTSFDVDGDVTRATFYASALGVYEVEVNGASVDDHVLKPGWTSYQWRLPLETTDVTDNLRAGRNTLGITLAGGWYTERFGFRDAAKRFYEGAPAVAGQMFIEYSDGRTQTIITDGAALWAPAPVTASSLYQGETYDARLEMTGWSTPEFDDAAWEPVVTSTDTEVIPTPRTSPPVRRIQELPVREILTTPTGGNHPRLRPEPRGLAANPGPRRGGRRHYAPPRRSPRTRRTRRAASAQRRRHRPLRAERNRHRDVGAPLHFPRLPLRTNRRVAGASRFR